MFMFALIFGTPEGYEYTTGTRIGHGSSQKGLPGLGQGARALLLHQIQCLYQS